MPSILIIGASSGIGAAVARACARQGWDVILHGRNEERLERVRKACFSDNDGGTPSVASDDPLEDTEVVPPRKIELLFGDVVAWSEDPKSIPAIEPVDAIVWSAGICELAAGQMLGLKAIRRTLSVNLEAPLVVLSHFYRKGIIRDGGTIVLLGSQSAHDAGEGFSVYAAREVVELLENSSHGDTPFGRLPSAGSGLLRAGEATEFGGQRPKAASRRSRRRLLWLDAARLPLAFNFQSGNCVLPGHRFRLSVFPS